MLLRSLIRIDLLNVGRVKTRVCEVIMTGLMMSDDDKNNSESLAEAAKEVLANLTAREAQVLRKRFGIDISSENTLQEIAAQFDATRERIQRIEEKALKKLARKKELEALPKCSFCKLRSDQVKRLIAAPDSDVFICDGCVRECLKVLEE